MTVANFNANKISTIPWQCHPAAITQMGMDGLHCPLGDTTQSERGACSYIKSFPVCAFVRLFVCLCVALKMRIPLDYANMAALAVCSCLAVSRLLDTPHSSVWVSKARHAHAQKFTVISWCDGTALAIGMCVF